MTKTDWVTIIVPIIANGFLLFFFEKVIESHIKKQDRRYTLKVEVVSKFLEKVEDVNNECMELNGLCGSYPEMFVEELKKVNDKLVDAVKFYNTKRVVLSELSTQCEEWERAWDSFVSLFKEGMDSEKNRLQLQEFEDETQRFVDTCARYLHNI
ncbi:MAG: hypothetical protein IJT71_03995 [Oscillospiraceae bacterium]|nr:hypothetical protein [Oscillospiraceae bacterium]